MPSDVELTEHGVADEFARRFRNRLRYCHHTGAWFMWDGARWQQNETKLAFTWARRLVASLNRRTEFKTRAVTGRTAFAAGVERFAQADEGMAVVSSAWDADPWLLGTPGGTVELRTGRLRPARQAEGITKATAVAPALTAACPAWLAFLHEAAGGDAELVRFLQLWAGYCLTGDTREHALAFVYGGGGNGKSVFISALSGILGDYARTAPMETFTASHNDRHPTELAMLRGARLVTASETEEGRAWAESRIKQMTGGDVLAARFMRRDFFEFRPQFKLTIIGNHKPALKNVDEAARRRFNIIPFLHRPAQPDRELAEKLRQEWPGILRWMVEGCLAWQREGLSKPHAVTEATAEYFEAQDHFGRWLAECCIIEPSLSTRPAALLHSFQDWCQENGEPIADNRRLRSLIERMPSLRYAKNNGTPWVRGIGLRSSRTEP
ncbi:hypothetical protein D9598_03105 [Roseomonas sp. KE0001]|nr:hypothetical protein [Roseomonas sp. KE0001]